MSDERASGFYLSEYQAAMGLAELEAAWEAGYRYVHIRASSGLHSDPLFDRHWRNAGQVGYLRSAWHYLTQGEWEQANLFRDRVGDRTPELGIYGDFEAADLTIAKCDTFLAATDAAFGLTCNIYTAKWWLDPRGKPPWQAQGRKLWVCDVNSPDEPILPQAFTAWEFWQHGCGHPPPFPCDVCVDRFNGTLADFYTCYGNAKQQVVAELLQAQAKNEEVAAHIGTVLALLQGGC